MKKICLIILLLMNIPAKVNASETSPDLSEFIGETIAEYRHIKSLPDTTIREKVKEQNFDALVEVIEGIVYEIKQIEVLSPEDVSSVDNYVSVATLLVVDKTKILIGNYTQDEFEIGNQLSENIYLLGNKKYDERIDYVYFMYLDEHQSELFFITLESRDDEQRFLIDKFNLSKTRFTENIAKYADFENYESISYDDVARNRNGLEGLKVKIYAEVTQFQEYGGIIEGLINQDAEYGNRYYVTYSNALLPEERILEGDKVMIYGELTGITSYETVLGGKETVPSINAHKVLIEGINY